MSKYKKGDKFIIEIGECHTHYTDEGKAYKLYRIKGFNTLVFDEYGLERLERYDDKLKGCIEQCEHENKINHLEKALDKACGYLVDNCPIKSPAEIGCDAKCENCWKEYLLKDGEE